MVPGAKPLSINEVRLSKDDDEDRDRHRSNDKRHSSNDSTNDKVTDENLQKNGAAKKGNAKVDNHIGMCKLFVNKNNFCLSLISFDEYNTRIIPNSNKAEDIDREGSSTCKIAKSTSV